MPAHDQLTALDATFLELEQADDSALMHIGAALVFDAAARRWDAGDRGGARAPRAALGPVAALPAEARRAPHRRASWPPGSAISASRSKRTSVTRRSRRRGTSASSWTGSRTSTRTAWTAAVRCGRWCCSTVWRTAAGRWCRRPTTAWSTASARSTSSTCCSTQSPRRASRQRATPRRCRLRRGRHGWLPHPPEPCRPGGRRGPRGRSRRRARADASARGVGALAGGDRSARP